MNICLADCEDFVFSPVHAKLNITVRGLDSYKHNKVWKWTIMVLLLLNSLVQDLHFSQMHSQPLLLIKVNLEISMLTQNSYFVSRFVFSIVGFFPTTIFLNLFPVLKYFLSKWFDIFSGMYLYPKEFFNGCLCLRETSVKVQFLKSATCWCSVNDTDYFR